MLRTILLLLPALAFGQVSPQKVRVCDPTTTACGVVSPDGAQAVTFDRARRFVCRVNGQTSMVNMTCTPALPGGAGIYFYVDSVVLSNGPTAQTLKVISSTTTACGGSPGDVTSSVYLGVNGGAALQFFTPIKTAQANAYLCCQGSGNTAASCTVTGFYGP